MEHFGNAFLVYCLVLGVVGVVAFFFKNKQSKILLRYGQVLFLLTFVFQGTALASLLVAIFQNDFSVVYVSSYSSIGLPWIYKISVLWAGPEGAALCLSLIISGIMLWESWHVKKASPDYFYGFLLIFSIFSLLLTAINFFILNPFLSMDFVPANGSGLDPMKQNLSAFFFPISASVAFVACFILFAWNLTALYLKDYGVFWLRSSNRWLYVLIFSIILTIFIGGVGAINKIMHNGFWNWDAMEIAALIPLFLSVVFIHSASVCMDRGRKKRVCFLLPFILFEFFLILVYMMHSVESQYLVTFERSRGKNYIFWLIMLTAAAFIPVYIRFFRKIKPLPSVILRPKELSLDISNIIFIISSFFLSAGLLVGFLWWRFAPHLVLPMSGYYFGILAPAGVACIVLMLFLNIKLFFSKPYSGTLIHLYIILVVAAVGTGACVAFWNVNPMSYFFFIVSGITIGIALLYGAKIIRRDGIIKFFKNVGSNGKFIVHLGVIVMCIGAVWASVYTKEYYIQTEKGKNFQVNGYNFLATDVNSLYKENCLCTFVNMEVEQVGQKIGTINPDMRTYFGSRNHYAEIGHLRLFLSSVSVAFISYNLKTYEMEFFISFYPNIWLIPFGLFVTLFGLVLIILGKRKLNE